jgi:hypothetical protein
LLLVLVVVEHLVLVEDQVEVEVEQDIKMTTQ